MTGFRFFTGKKLLEKTSVADYALASFSHSLTLLNFQGHRTRDMIVRKVDFGWIEATVLFFAFCAGVNLACNAVFRLKISCCIPEMFAI